MDFLNQAKTWLDAQHTAIYPIALVAAIWLVQYAVRRWFPGVWEWAADLPFRDSVVAFDRALRKAWQGLPSVVLGAVGLWSAGGGKFVDLVLGAILGVLAPVLHEFLKATPLPYRGGKPPAAESKEA